MDYYLDDDRYQDGLEYQEELDHGCYCPECGEYVDQTDYFVSEGMCRACAEEASRTTRAIPRIAA